jgi:hypothetical protein
MYNDRFLITNSVRQYLRPPEIHPQQELTYLGGYGQSLRLERNIHKCQ